MAVSSQLSQPRCQMRFVIVKWWSYPGSVGSQEANSGDTESST
jgi:hypothetical protein